MRPFIKTSIVLIFVQCFLLAGAGRLPARPVVFAVPAVSEGLAKLRQWSPLIEYLELESGLDINFVIARDHKTIREGLESNQYDFAFVDPLWCELWLW